MANSEDLIVQCSKMIQVCLSDFDYESCMKQIDQLYKSIECYEKETKRMAIFKNNLEEILNGK